MTGMWRAVGAMVVVGALIISGDARATICKQKRTGVVAIRDGACKRKELPVDPAELTAPLADGAVTSAKIADGAVTSSKIATSAVGDEQLADHVASILIPAEAINSNVNVTRTSLGLSFIASFTAGASVAVPMPRDWDRVSTFTVKLYFSPETDTAGVVSFFLRVAGRKTGDQLFDPGPIDGPAVTLPATPSARLLTQTFTVPASKVPADSEMLHIFGIQRGGAGETYPDAVTLRTVEVSYTAAR